MSKTKYYLLLFIWLFLAIVTFDRNYFAVVLPFSIGYYLSLLIFVVLILVIIDAVRTKEKDEEDLFLDQ